MSHYLSTFLYEPIVRQARRFSSPGNAEALGLFHSFYGRATVENVGGQGVVDEEGVSMNISENNTHGHTSPISQQALSHTTVIDSPELALEPHGEREQSSMNVRPRSQFQYRRSDGSIDDILRPLDNDVPLEQRVSFEPRRSSTIISDSNMASDAHRQVSGRSRRNTERQDLVPNATSYNVLTGDTVLPEDDGMGFMRREIVQIQHMNTSNIEKSRRMHELMTRRYNSSHQQLSTHHYLQGLSPRSVSEQYRPLTPSSGHSLCDTFQSSPIGTAVSSVLDSDGLCLVKPEDLAPTYYQAILSSLSNDSVDISMAQDLQSDQARPLGCVHYRRNVKLQCSACYRWYTCRFCHDEVEDHSLNRRETKNMLCMLCGCAQPAAEACKDCGERGGWYYCDVCKLWDDDPEKYIYHCNDCGICRLGKGIGKDLFHCKTCCVCLSIAVKDTHRCIERSIDCDCPICGDYMFTSPQTVVFMRCGHSIHLNCYNDHIKSSYRCPICSRSMMNMEMQFRHLDRAIENQPMPEQFRDTKAWVYCNDCSAKTEVQYHWLGLKCAVCDSYNTAQISITSIQRAGPTDHGAQTLDVHSVTDSVDPLLPEAVYNFTRGRSQFMNDLPRRPANSASALEIVLRRSPHVELGGTRSASASAGERSTPFQGGFPGELQPCPGNESTDEEDEVDFWGGESPREKAVGANSKETLNVNPSDGDDSDEEDDLMDDKSLTADDDDDDDDRMELFGHR